MAVAKPTRAHRLALAAAAAVLAASAIACGGARQARSPSGDCAGARPVRCLTAPTCSVDPTSGCEVCRCSAPPYISPQRGDAPTGPAVDPR